MPTLMRSLLALTLLSIGTTTGCAWTAIVDDILDGKDGAGKGGGGTGTGAGNGPGTDPGASLTCDAVPNADGTVCKRCVDASGVVVREDCASSSGTGSGGSTGNGTGTAGSAGSSCVRFDGGGDPTSCKDSATWKKYGADACAQQNLVLSDIAFGPACGANFQNVVYVCCGTVAPGCSLDTDALGNTCKTCWDATGVVVESVCKSSGVTCEESAGADGATCKTCKYPDGRIYSAECHGGSTGGTEICDVKTSADGTVCKVCYQPDGTTISSCP